jgi:hypothetical protein
VKIKNKNLFVFGLVLIVSCILDLKSLHDTGCIRYFQRIQQCGLSANIGFSILAISGIILIFLSLRKSNKE